MAQATKMNHAPKYLKASVDRYSDIQNVIYELMSNVHCEFYSDDDVVNTFASELADLRIADSNARHRVLNGKNL